MTSLSKSNPHSVPMHPDLQVQEYALLIDSISWELDFLKQAGWKGSVRYQRLIDIQQRIQTFIDQAQ